MRAWVLAFILLLAGCVAGAGAAFAEPMDTLAQPFECAIRPSAAPVAVTDMDGKPTGLKLAAGERIYARSTPQQSAYWAVIQDGRSRLVALPADAVPDKIVDCGDKRRDYPVVFVGPQGQRELTTSFGIANDEPVQPRGAVKCPSFGAGQVGMSLAAPLVASAAKDGIDLGRLCMVLSSGQVRYDPESGERLPTYVIVTPADASQHAPAFVSDEYLFSAPKCFARSKVTDRPQDLVSVMNPIGCRVLFHPWSGRRLSQGESRYFTENTYLWIGGEGGGSIEDSQDLANDASRRFTSAKIGGIKAQMPK